MYVVTPGNGEKCAASLCSVLPHVCCGSDVPSAGGRGPVATEQSDVSRVMPVRHVVPKSVRVFCRFPKIEC